jgi:hypothetical protein
MIPSPPRPGARPRGRLPTLPTLPTPLPLAESRRMLLLGQGLMRNTGYADGAYRRPELTL